ncbi:unnamed protein product [Phytophthora lilii]|uniref:Unnamed protein product n=1 Tax=Phytophthora lilii TaxID=2077276 RepID=A0A9W6TD56_9STRA|nr:unnamed protein product [Phytophthora lilii]
MMQSFLTPPSEVIFSVKRWSLQELASNRLPEEQLGSEKVMKRYQRGEPSDTLYVKNIAKIVELADLMAVFGAVLPSESGPEYELISCLEFNLHGAHKCFYLRRVLKIRHFTEGRMKCQAFVTYPTVELASCALKEVHGVVLKDKPLIVVRGQICWMIFGFSSRRFMPPSVSVNPRQIRMNLLTQLTLKALNPFLSHFYITPTAVHPLSPPATVVARAVSPR